MKLYYTGLVPIDPPVDYGSQLLKAYQYNCLRNPACQKPYYVPLKTFTDLILYMDFPFGNPDTVTFNVGDCNNVLYNLTYTNYVVGQTPDGSWYGVFTGWIENISSITGLSFTITAIATKGSSNYIYLSEMMENSVCDVLMKLSSCYNNTPFGSNAFDCNGIYYGFANPDTVIGNDLLRYYHHAYVRQGNIYERSNKFQFTYFNNKTAYRNFFTRNYLLQFELVPTFYKDILIGILNRGNIEIDTIAYRLDDSQEISLTNEDLKFWKMDMSLTNLCKQYFSCTPTICIPDLPACEGNPTGVTINDLGEGFFDMTFTGGVIGVGETVEWYLYEDDNLVTAIDSGTTTSTHDAFNIALDPFTHCYTLKWRKHCVSGSISDYISQTFGACDCCAPVMSSSFTEVSGGHNILHVEFEECIPAPSIGYILKYRPLGDTTAYSVTTSTTSPFIIDDGGLYPEGTEFEGYLLADCGFVQGNQTPFVTGGYGCDDNVEFSYPDNDHHFYDPIFLSIFAATTVTLNWESFDRPNKFTVFDVTTGLQVATTDWVGFADYSGPWGTPPPNLLTPESGSLAFAHDNTHIYKVVVEAGNADPETPESDSANFTIVCT